MKRKVKRMSSRRRRELSQVADRIKDIRLDDIGLMTGV